MKSLGPGEQSSENDETLIRNENARSSTRRMATQRKSLLSADDRNEREEKVRKRSDLQAAGMHGETGDE